jgi:hypothetical protein
VRRNIDTFIKEQIQQEQIKVPESYLNKVDMTLQGLPEDKMENTKVFNKPRFRYAAAIAVGFFLVMSVTAYATVNYVQKRMLSISDNEKQELVDYTNESTLDADSYSREFTDDEKDRMETLLYDYQFQGMFPENDLEIVDNKEMIEKDTLAFIPEDSLFVLPERTLTDEELLQIIDFYYKRDYSIITSNEDITIDKPTVDNEIGEDCVEQMKTMISIIYQVDTDNLDATIEADINDLYYIEIDNSESGSYLATYDLDEQRITEIEFITSVDTETENIEPDNEHFVEVGKEFTQTIRKLDSNDKIKEIYCDYNITEDKVLSRAIVSYIYILENGECYVVKYNPILETVTDLFIVSYDSYQQTLDNNAAKLEKRGIQRIRISVDVKYINP